MYARTNDPTTDECYNEQFVLIKSGRYDERLVHLYYGNFDYSFH